MRVGSENYKTRGVFCTSPDVMRQREERVERDLHLAAVLAKLELQIVGPVLNSIPLLIAE